LVQRAKEIEAELGKKTDTGLGVLIEKTMRSKGKEDTRIWTYVKRDNSLITVQVAIRPLFDEKSIFGFVEVATEVEPQSLTPQIKEGFTPALVNTPLPPSPATQSTTFLTNEVPQTTPQLTDDQIVNSLFNSEGFDIEHLELLENHWF